MDENKTPVSTELDSVLSSALTLTGQSYPIMVEKVGKARAALSKIQKIDTDEEDKYANDILVKVKLTYEAVSAMRTEITGPLDSIKAKLMEPEKEISLEKSHEALSEAFRVKKLRNNYATIKAQKIQDDQKKLNAKKMADEELANLKATFEERFYANVMNRVAQLRTDINAYFNQITNDNFEEKSKKFALAPKLKQEDFESWFIIDYDKNKLPVEQFAEFLAKVKDSYKYENINAIYVEQAMPVFQEYKDKLPALKIQLQELAELAETDAEAANFKLEEAALVRKQEVESKNAEITAAIAEKQEEVQHEKESDLLNAEFSQQVGSQNLDQLKNVRYKNVAIITGPNTSIVTILSKVLFANYTNPSFSGHFKRDKNTKEILKDEQGQPILADWAEYILDFYANNCSETAIDGIEIKQVVTSVIKK